MNEIDIVTYDSGRSGEWDQFVEQSKNGVFLFKRDYLEYHADRFPDASLMFYQAGDLVAVLPATVRDAVMSSHAGLTFGGFVTGDDMKVGLMLDIFAALRQRLRDSRITQLTYKAIPHIYHRLPAEEDLYALFREGAHLYRRDISATIDTTRRLPLSKGRTYSIKKARKHGITVGRSQDFGAFMAIEQELLRDRYGKQPVHSTEEITLLAGRFPDNIKLFAAHHEGRMIAGVIVYESHQVAHAQYIGSTDEGRDIGAPDLLMSYLIEDCFASKRYFDFGISTEDDGQYLNAGLIENKQGFGARAVACDFYRLEIGQP
jgi:hypothetical protein